VALELVAVSECDEQAAKRLTAAKAPKILLYMRINPCQTL
jgi:hypothetical protein